MQRVPRWVGIAYGGLLLSFLCWFLTRGLEPGSNGHHRLFETMSVLELAGVWLVPLLGLLLSHQFVRRGRFRGGAATLVLCVCLSASNLVDTTDRAWNRTLPSAVTVKHTVASALPLGSGLSTVLSFLQKNRIEHSGYEADARQVRAIVRIHPRGWLRFGGGIRTVFRFDDRKKLMGLDVDEEWVAW